MTTPTEHAIDLSLTEANWENLNFIVEAYDELRSRVYKAIQANHRLMGSDAWLRHAIEERELHLSIGPAGISVRGSTFTCQTQSNEWFDFPIPFAEL